MATAVKSVFPDASGYTTFAAWAKWITDTFVTFGWAQTADYGQVNWTDLAASSAVPQSSSPSTWTSYVGFSTIDTGAAGFVASAGSLTINMAVTTGMYPGKAVLMQNLAGSGANAGVASYNGMIFTITSVAASTSITVKVPMGWSFSYQVTTGSVLLQPAFMIFESQDSLTAACPIYVKVELAGVSGSNAPWLRFTIGSGGSNGFGILNTNAVLSQATAGYQATTSTLHPCYLSGDAGSFRAALFLPVGTDGNVDSYGPQYVIIARSRDNNGNQTANYVMYWEGFSQGASLFNLFQTVFPPLGGMNVVDSTGYLMSGLGKQTTGAMNGVTMVSPVFQNVGGLSNPTPDLLVGFGNDFPFNTPATILVYGVNHNYIAMRPLTNSPYAGAAQNGNTTLLMRWE